MSRTTIPGWDPIVEVYKRWLETMPRPGAVVVEVGVALGRSLTYVADYCVERGRKDVEVYAVDSWAHNAPNGEQQTMAADAGGDFSLYAKMLLAHDPKAFEVIRPIRATSERAARMFDDGSVDLVLIDADHSYEGCISDIRAWLPKVRAGGWIGGDDHHEEYHPGVIKACKEAFGDRYEVFKGANNWPDGRAWLHRVP